MPVDTRVSVQSKKGLDPTPYMARIVSHLDPSLGGGLEVSLLRSSGNEMGDETQTFVVRYSSPFYGVSALEHGGKNNSFDDNQKSYGFWAVPPDVGVTGIVIFIDGDPSQGFWLACVPDKLANHMVPGLAGSNSYTKDKDTVDNLQGGEATHPLPVVEVNRQSYNLEKGMDIDKAERPVHPFAKALKRMGLTKDEFRGIGNASARRDVPSTVYGMSTPGPLDRAGKKAFVGHRQSHTATPVPVNRLGGTQFIIDDGDDRYYREKSPSEGPPKYVPVSPDGPSEFPYNECTRLRTRTGHQILLHNSENLIYISHASGNSWIEMTADGKIDIFSADSVSIRTKNDFNFYADRDINIECKRNFTLKVGKDMKTEVRKDWNLFINEKGKVTVKKTYEFYGEDDVMETTLKSFHVNAKKSIFNTSGGSNETKAGGNIIESAPQIHMNGPGAGTATQAVKLEELKTCKLPDITSPDPAMKDKPAELETILCRAPTFEPYPHHENLNPAAFKKDKTDSDKLAISKDPAEAWRKYQRPGNYPI